MEIVDYGITQSIYRGEDMKRGQWVIWIVNDVDMYREVYMVYNWEEVSSGERWGEMERVYQDIPQSIYREEGMKRGQWVMECIRYRVMDNRREVVYIYSCKCIHLKRVQVYTGECTSASPR